MSGWSVVRYVRDTTTPVVLFSDLSEAGARAAYRDNPPSRTWRHALIGPDGSAVLAQTSYDPKRSDPA